MNIFKKNICKKCPYTLGIVKTFVNPCPDCKENGYKSPFSIPMDKKI